MTFKVQVCSKKGQPIPVRSSEGAVGFDVYAPEDVYLPRGGRCMVDTGILIRTEGDIFPLLGPRSHSGKKLYRLANTLGFIDLDYTGPSDTLKVMFYRPESHDRRLFTGDFHLGEGPSDPNPGRYFDEGLECCWAQGAWRAFKTLPHVPDILYKKGDLIAQVIFLPAVSALVVMEEVEFDAWGATGDRGGFGSTGGGA